jgi:hypothetical protein
MQNSILCARPAYTRLKGQLTALLVGALSLAFVNCAGIAGSHGSTSNGGGSGGGGIDPFQTVGSMSAARRGAAATYISTGPLTGFVLITGGIGSDGVSLNTAELYNPTTGTFQPSGTMTAARSFHTSDLMTEGPLAGDVLLTGGYDSAGNTLSSAEIYNAATGVFQSVGGMFSARVYHSSLAFTFAGTSYVLVAGGLSSTGTAINKIEVFDPATETFSSGGTMKAARQLFTATSLADPASASTSTTLNVLFTGGIGSGGSPLSSSEI